ncbi:trans-2,3-enoyl-CoA reductase-like 2b, partial [Tachysurus ichikawai]
MDSLELKDLFTVAQFIKARCDHGLKAGEPKNIKNYVFFEVEILDPKTRTQLCYLDKVDPSATVGEIKTLLHRLYPKWYPARQALKLHPGKIISFFITLIQLTPKEGGREGGREGEGEGEG